MLLSLLMMTGCIDLVDTECTTNQYLAISGNCVQDPGQIDLFEDTGLIVDEEDDEAEDEGGSTGDDGSATEGGSDTEGSSDGESTGGDSEGDGGGGGPSEPILESVTITCDAGGWYYQAATAISTESATVTITETGSTTGDIPTEFHTLTMSGESSSGGETYQRDLLLVEDYYFEDVATQFPCTDGSNPNLTWQIDLYTDAGRTDRVGCATLGHDTSASIAAGCQEL